MEIDKYFELIKTYKLLANKSLGQNFLTNSHSAEDIVNLANLLQNDTLLEIGAGLGSLSIYEVGKCNCTLIDIDERMLAFLHEHFDDKNCAILRQNILKADLTKYTKIIGNLPYYITTGIIEHILLNAVNATTIVLMTQKEVYPRLLLSEVSPLSLMLNYVAKISSPKNINRNNFTPVPHVDSVVFTLTPNCNIKNNDNKTLYRLMSKLFIHKRKTLSNCLASIVGDKNIAEDLLKKSNIDPMFRPEQIGIEQYINLLNQLKSTDFATRI